MAEDKARDRAQRQQRDLRRSARQIHVMVQRARQRLDRDQRAQRVAHDQDLVDLFSCASATQALIGGRTAPPASPAGRRCPRDRKPSRLSIRWAKRFRSNRIDSPAMTPSTRPSARPGRGADHLKPLARQPAGQAEQHKGQQHHHRVEHQPRRPLGEPPGPHEAAAGEEPGPVAQPGPEARGQAAAAEMAHQLFVAQHFEHGLGADAVLLGGDAPALDTSDRAGVILGGRRRAPSRRGRSGGDSARTSRDRTRERKARRRHTWHSDRHPWARSFPNHFTRGVAPPALRSAAHIPSVDNMGQEFEKSRRGAAYVCLLRPITETLWRLGRDL